MAMSGDAPTHCSGCHVGVARSRCRLISHLIKIIERHFGDMHAALDRAHRAPELERLSISFFVSLSQQYLLPHA